MSNRLAIVAISAVALGLAAGAAQAREMRIGLITPPPHLWTQNANKFAEELKTATEGRHSLSVFPAGQLGNEAQMLQQLQTGALDMMFITAAEVSNRVPEFNALFTPFLVENNAHAARFLKDSKEAKALLDLLPQRIGAVGLGYGMAGLRQVVSRQPIASAGDLKGKKVRITPSPAIRDLNTILGTAPTPMPLPAVYDALANGQVDAIEMDLELTIKNRYYELAPNVLVSNQMMFPMVALVSSRVWQQIPEADQKIIAGLAKKYGDAVLDQTAAIEADYEKQLRAKDKVAVQGANEQFYAEAIKQWEQQWLPKAPIAKLRAEATTLKP